MRSLTSQDDRPAWPGPGAPPRPTWGSLPARARAFRIAHVAWGVVAMTALAHIWRCATFRRRDRALWPSVAFLLVQGGALVIGRGNCPFGPFQRQLGDPVPMFELALPPRAAKAAIPVLFVVSVSGIVAVAIRRPRAEGPAGPRSLGPGPGARTVTSVPDSGVCRLLARG